MAERHLCTTTGGTTGGSDRKYHLPIRVLLRQKHLRRLPHWRLGVFSVSFKQILCINFGANLGTEEDPFFTQGLFFDRFFPLRERKKRHSFQIKNEKKNRIILFSFRSFFDNEEKYLLICVCSFSLTLFLIRKTLVL